MNLLDFEVKTLKVRVVAKANIVRNLKVTVQRSTLSGISVGDIFKLCHSFFKVIPATCINCAKINNSMLPMHGHASAFFAVTSYSCKVKTRVSYISLQVLQVKFLNRCSKF